MFGIYVFMCRIAFAAVYRAQKARDMQPEVIETFEYSQYVWRLLQTHTQLKLLQICAYTLKSKRIDESMVVCK